MLVPTWFPGGSGMYVQEKGGTVSWRERVQGSLQPVWMAFGAKGGREGGREAGECVRVALHTCVFCGSSCRQLLRNCRLYLSSPTMTRPGANPRELRDKGGCRKGAGGQKDATLWFLWRAAVCCSSVGTLGCPGGRAARPCCEVTSMKDFPPWRGKGLFYFPVILNGDCVDQMQGKKSSVWTSKAQSSWNADNNEPKPEAAFGRCPCPLGHEGAQWKAFAPLCVEALRIVHHRRGTLFISRICFSRFCFRLC